MTNTHTMQDIEGLILEKLDILKNGSTKTEKVKARREIIKLEKFYNDINMKNINGHKYPVKEVPPKTSKKELLELIDSVPDGLIDLNQHKPIHTSLDLSGVSVGSNRFTFTEKG